MRAKTIQAYNPSGESGATSTNLVQSTIAKIPNAEMIRFDQNFQPVLSATQVPLSGAATHPADIGRQTPRENSPSVGDPIAFSYEILDCLPVMATMIDMQTRKILYANAHVRKLFGEVIGQTCWRVLQKNQPGPCPFCTDRHLTNEKGALLDSYQQRLKNTITGQYYEVTDSAMRTKDGRLVKVSIAMAVGDQAEPLPSSKALCPDVGDTVPHQFVVMCAHCNKIRDDAGEWLHPARYLRQEMGTLVSHGMCGSCAKRFYPEFSDELDRG